MYQHQSQGKVILICPELALSLLWTCSQQGLNYIWYENPCSRHHRVLLYPFWYDITWLHHCYYFVTRINCKVCLTIESIYLRITIWHFSTPLYYIWYPHIWVNTPQLRQTEYHYKSYLINIFTSHRHIIHTPR